jgi:redox-sensitive bicupin YhaK (pirin superfamily)
MGMFRVYPGPDGESHIEEVDLAAHPEYRDLQNISEIKIQHFAEPRNMDFHPLPERRLIFHLTGEVEIGVSDGSKQIFRPGDIRLMEDISGRGHTHRDLTQTSAAAYVFFDD